MFFQINSSYKKFIDKKVIKIIKTTKLNKNVIKIKVKTENKTYFKIIIKIIIYQ